MPFRDEEGYEPTFWKEVGMPLLIATVLSAAVWGPILYMEFIDDIPIALHG